MEFQHTSAPTGTKFLILHFTDVSLPSGNRLEVDLGYDTDTFTAADGASFWTRPVNVAAFANGKVPIRYIASGATSGAATLDKYGRGERLPGDVQAATSLSNPDIFLTDSPYVEPDYQDLFCADDTPPQWQNVECLPAADIRRTVQRSCGMIIMVHGNEVSSCSVTCIGPDLILTAGHCLAKDGTPADAAAEALSASVTFEFQTECDGDRPPSYDPRFFKVKELLQRRWILGVADFAVLKLRVPPAGLGVPPIDMRSDLPAPGEEVFGVHHPNGAVKKLSPPAPGYTTVGSSSSSGVVTNLDITFGSSGSGLFDTMGRLVGVLSFGSPCSWKYYPSTSILDDIAAAPAPSPDREVMLVIDRSGSMQEATLPMGTKMEAARDAASLFVQLIRSGTQHRLGLVSFSTTASDPVDKDLSPINAGTKQQLVGPSPYSSGIVGGLSPGGMTSIGDGLEAARDAFPAPNPRRRTILLLTDGMQNTPPMIETVEPTLADVDIHAIGFGTESNLDGAILTQLTQAHNGLYTRSGDGLNLRKYFALAFGDIFEMGALADPVETLPAESSQSEPFRFHVCGEEWITVVLGWDRPDVPLGLEVRTPTGDPVNPTTVVRDEGRAWAFVRVPLPHGGQRDGRWEASVFRLGHGGEFPPPAAPVRYFITVLAQGGPVLRRVPDQRRYYTGDPYNPLVQLRYLAGGGPTHANVTLAIESPDKSAGTILAEHAGSLRADLQGDTVAPRFAALRALEQERPIRYVENRTTLKDDHENTGTFGETGVHGRVMPDLLKVEGNYTFHVQATYGQDCTATRETTWSLHVEVGVDPDRTTIRIEDRGPASRGRRSVVITIVPRDKYGNHLGPGKADRITVSGAAGTEIDGPLQDAGEGAYRVPAVWDPASGQSAGVVVSQPGRAPVAVCGDGASRPPKWSSHWVVWLLLLLILMLAVTLLVAIV